MTCPPCSHDCNEGRNCPNGEKIKALQNMDNLLLHKQVQSAVARFVRDFRAKREEKDILERSVEALPRKASRKSEGD